ncbi:hypothetical protein Plec18167_008176 [Paecilomyces lecythidis]|uniref:Uncharacterized protein n=1 Tax=Paecilomyces lecythidis TaxID=3004212 RepID=A0ABR3WY15_9EURO
MAARSMDALQSFAYLSENLPSWITRVSDLATYTAAKHAEFSAEYKKLTHVKPRRRKNSSLHSLRPDDMNPTEKKGTSQKEQVPEDAPAANPRKRRTEDESSVRSGEDAPQIIRSRHMVVVHYDGHAQKEMEQVVRDIGSARNNIRRGKMSQMVKPGGFSMSMFSKMSDPSTTTFGQINAAQTASELAAAVGPMRNTKKESPFDFADKQLELAQSLCESGAHQFLRCGDCSAELQGVQEKFRILLEMATTEVERLKEEKRLQELNKSEEEEEDSHQEPAKDKPTGVTAPAAENGKPPAPGSMAIEVDDNASEESISIDLAAFRSASRFRI